MRARIVPYAPFGAQLAALPDALEVQVVSPLGDQLPTASVHYPQSGVNAGVLEGVEELAFEYWDGSAWVEPPNCRYMVMRGSRDHLEEVPTQKYEFTGLGWLLRGAKVWEPAGLPVDEDGKVLFNSASAGQIMATLFGNAQRRGWAPGLSVDFSAARDSAGAAWAKVLTIAYDVDVDLETVLANLYQQGVCDYRWEGRTLRLFNPDTAMGRDLAGGASPVRLLVADGQTAAPEDWTNEDRATHALVLGEEGRRWNFSNGGGSPWGRLERVITQGGVSDEGTAALLAEPDLLAGVRTRFSFTREFTLTPESARWPFRDFGPGDWVQAQRGTSFERLRVQSVSVTVNADGVKGHAVLGDKLEDLLTKLAKRTKGITGGASAGGSGVRPAPEGPDRRVPAAPSGLTVGVDAYLDDEGVARGRVDLAWAHSGRATNGTAMDVDRYQVHYRVNAQGATWRHLTSTGDKSLAYSPLPLFKSDGRTPEQYAFRVRGIGENGLAGPFSAQVAVVMEDDTTPPPAPEFRAQDLTTWLRTVTVRCSGRGVEGGTVVDMPRDLDHFNVYRAGSATGAGTLVGVIRGAHELWQSGTMPLERVWFYLTAVDRSGNESPRSAVQSVTPAQLVNVAEIIAKIDAAEVVIENAGQLALENGETLRQKLAANDDALAGARANLDALAGRVSPLESGLRILETDTLPTLQRSVDGKSAIFRKTAAPAADDTSGAAGDRWEVWSNLNANGQLRETWRRTATGWVQERIDPVYLPKVDISEGTFGSFHGSRLEAGTVLADKLLIGIGGNIFPDPGMVDAAGYQSGLTMGGPGSGKNGRGSVLVPSGSGQQGGYYGLSDRSRRVPVTPGAQYRISAWVRANEAIPAFSAVLYARGYTEANAWAFTSPSSVNNGGAVLAANTWHLLQGIVTVPDDCVTLVLGFYSSSNLTGPLRFSDPSVQPATSGDLVAAGTITGEHVDARTVGAAVGSFVKADIGNLVVTGSSQMEEAVIGRLWGDVLNYRKISTSQLTVAPHNLLPDPMHMDAEITRARVAESDGPWQWGGVDPDTAYSGRIVRLESKYTGEGLFRFTPLNTAADLRIPVSPGQQIVVEVDYRWRGITENAAADSWLQVPVWFDNASKGYVSFQQGPKTSNTGVNAVWRTVTQKFIVPAGVAFARLAVRVQNQRYTQFEIGAVRVREAVPGDLIVDGSVLTRHLTVTADMTAALLRAKKVEAGEIDVNSLTADAGFIGSLRTGILTSNSVVSTMIDGNAITAKHTLTGPLYQTTATANRGIKISDSLKFRVYDGSGNLRVHLGTGSSDLVAVPELRTAPRGQKGIALINSWKEGQPALVLSETGSVDSGEPAMWVDTYKILNIQGLMTSGAPYGLVNVKGQLSVGDYWESGERNAAHFVANQNIVRSTIGASEIVVQSDLVEMRRTGTTRRVAIVAEQVFLQYQERSLIVNGNGTYVNGNFTVGGSKNFVMPHPFAPESRELVHGSTESPVSGIEYWGTAAVGDDGSVVVELPDYFAALAKPRNRAVLVVGNGGPLSWSEIHGCAFTVWGSPGTAFSWLVKAERYGGDFETERDRVVPNVPDAPEPSWPYPPPEETTPADGGSGAGAPAPELLPPADLPALEPATGTDQEETRNDG